MKLVLTESQYNRIFNNKKRKLVITESQYRKILNEASSNMLLSMEKGDTLELIDKSNNKLSFKIIMKTGNEIIMINCNDGVYKNAYFHLKGDSLNGNNLTYQIAQNDKIPEGKNPWETVGDSSIWRKSTFKNVKSFDVFKDGGEGLKCNLSDTAERKFSLDVDTGKVTRGGEDTEEKEEVASSGDQLKEFKDNLFSKGLEPGSWYKIVFHDDSSFKIKAIEKSGGYVSITFQELNGRPITGGEVKGYALRWLKPLADGEEYVKSNNTSINIDDIKAGRVNKETGELETFDIPIEVNYSDGPDRKTKKFMFNGVKDIIKSKGTESFKGGKEKEGEGEIAKLSDEKMKELLEKLVTNSDYLNSAIVSKPNHFLELIGVSRKRGILPAKGRLADWGLAAELRAKSGSMVKKFPINKVFDATFETYKISDKDNAPKLKSEYKFKMKALKPLEDKGYHRFGSNLMDNMKTEEAFQYNIYLVRELEERDDFYIYDAQLYKKVKENSARVEVATGKLKIFKDRDKDKNNTEEKKD